jgi:hypothetical protein
MRLSIRSEQMLVLETVAQENFVRRIAAHLVAEYPKALVTLPTDEKFTVEELPEEKLDDLVRTGIARARGHQMTFESSIAAFTAVMFEVSPNFDQHRLCQVLLNDEHIEPNSRLDELLDVLTEKNWDSIRADYNPQAWVLEEEIAPEETPETEESQVKPDAPKNLGFETTVRNYP